MALYINPDCFTGNHRRDAALFTYTTGRNDFDLAGAKVCGRRCVWRCRIAAISASGIGEGALERSSLGQ